MRSIFAFLFLVLFLACPLNSGATGAVAAKSPERIVSLAPSCTEIIAGLGLQDKLVGITEHTDYPPEVLDLPVVGSYVNLNLEAIVSLQPDLVVATDDGNPLAVVQRLEKLSIPVYAMNLRTYEKIRQSILEFGKFLGREKEATAMAQRMSHAAQCIAQKTQHRKGPTVFFAYQNHPLISPGAGTFTDQLIKMSGGRSITHDVKLSYLQITMEEIVAQNPDVIIESSMDPAIDRETKLKWWNQWKVLDAVKNNRVYILDSRNLDRPSQRVVYGFLQLARTLHPELFPDDECLHENNTSERR